MNNLPKINYKYWSMILLCTTMGELIGNLLSRNFQLGYTLGAIIDICIFSFFIFGVLFFKFKNDFFYWLLILMGNIGGTNLADWVTLEPLDNDKKWGLLKPLQLGTTTGSLAVLGTLFLVLFLWKITNREQNQSKLLNTILYWFAILISSTFGTTSGDFITNDTPLGALGGSIFLIFLLAIVYLLFKYKKLNQGSCYWLALVLMHPIGATIGNYVSKPIGLNLGNIYTNLVMIILFAIIYLQNKYSLSKAAI